MSAPLMFNVRQYLAGARTPHRSIIFPRRCSTSWVVIALEKLVLSKLAENAVLKRVEQE